MMLRYRLTALFALFAALPLLAAVLPVSRALDGALEQEYRARLDGAARAVAGEYRRVAREAAAAAREAARAPEVSELAEERNAPGFESGRGCGPRC